MDNAFLTILEVLRQIALGVTFLGAAFVVFLILRQEKVKAWFGENSKLQKIVVFIVLSYLLFTVAAFFIDVFVGFPRGLSLGNPLPASMQCLKGLLALAGLVVGSILLVRSKKEAIETEEIEEIEEIEE